MLSLTARQGLSRYCIRLVCQYMAKVHCMLQPDMSAVMPIYASIVALPLVYIVTAVAHTTACARHALHRADKVSPLAPVIM